MNCTARSATAARWLAYCGLPLLCACQQATIKPLDRDSSPSILAYHESVVPAEHKDYALTELQRGLLFFDLGDFLDADRRFANACEVMDRIAGDQQRETTAILWSEESKTYKGEPHERATAYVYRGLCRYKLKDYAGALAAFRHSLACTAETRTKDQKTLENFAIGHVLAALCYLQLGERENAQAALNVARQYNADHPFLDAQSLGRSFVAVIAVGQGPYLRPSRLDSSIKQVDCPACAEARIDVLIDGVSIGEAAETTDLFEQAKSQGWGEMDSVRLTKAVAKRAISYVPYVGMASYLIQAQADLRCWAGLPRKYYVVAADVAPGLHSVTLRFLSDKGDVLPRYEQVWFDVPVAEGSNLLCFRSVPDAQNCYGLTAQPIGVVNDNGQNALAQGGAAP